MSTMGRFAQLEAQKGMIRHIIKASNLEVNEEELMPIVEEVQGKILKMHVHREWLKTTQAEDLERVSAEYEASIESVLDSFVYFSLILENVLLERHIRRLTEDDE